MTPPSPRPSDRRRHERRELFAAVRLRLYDDTLLLGARNISLGGVLLDVGENLVDRFALGSEHELLIFDAVDDSRTPVRVVGQVVRHDPGAVALSWPADDPASAPSLVKLLASLQPRQ